MKLRLSVGVAAFWLLATLPLFAHHAFMAEFDQRQPMTVTGIVTKVEWINPHPYFYVEVKDQNGKVETWSFETAAPSALVLRGWKRHSLNVGDKVTVQGYRAKSTPNLAAARSVVFPDGNKVFTGTMNDGGPEQ